MGTFFRAMISTDSGLSWAGNGYCYRTREHAEESARDLMSRWLLVTDWRVDPIEGKERDGKLHSWKAADGTPTLGIGSHALTIRDEPFVLGAGHRVQL